METNDSFWNAIDRIVSESKIIIDRPKGAVHPKFSDFIYRVDYGYLDKPLQWMVTALMYRWEQMKESKLMRLCVSLI